MVFESWRFVGVLLGLLFRELECGSQRHLTRERLLSCLHRTLRLEGAQCWGALRPGTYASLVGLRVE